MKRTIILITLVFGVSTHAQQNSIEPVVPLRMQRKPPTSPTVPPLIQKYDFGAQLRLLQDVDSPGSKPVVLPPPTSVNMDTDVPNDFGPKTDLPLDPPALEAIDVSTKWQHGDIKPMAGTDGRVVYAYGSGLPTVVCAPLRVCMIELQAGEHIAGEPHIGDSVRWHVLPATFGSGAHATPLIVLKPQVSGLDTNLLVTTDRRAYYFRLMSKPEDYVVRVAFEYPEEERRQAWQEHAEAQAVAKQIERSDAPLPATITAEQLNFDYTIKGGNQHIRPTRVFDDGAKTFIQMPQEIEHREAPVLVVSGLDGKAEMTNYRVKNQTYVVDRLFDRAYLLLGSGKKAQKVEINRGTKN